MTPQPDRPPRAILDWRRDRNALLFLATTALLAGASTYLLCGMLRFSATNLVLAAAWVLGFAILFLNVAYMLVAALVSRGFPERRLAASAGGSSPPTAIVYVVRNEAAAPLFEKMRASFAGNASSQADLWLLSNSDSPPHAAAERRLLSRLRETFDRNRVHLFVPADNPLRRKHTALDRWLAAHPEYDYLVVCDADTLLPPGSVAALVGKAEHPENRGVGLFQSRIHALPGATYFSRWLGGGQEICQKIYASAHQKAFGRGVSFGSGCLIRCRALRQIEVPDWVLSHDIWDTALLEAAGHRVVYAGDVVTYGEFPGTYVEYLKRSRRWILGTLESLAVCRRPGPPLATRLMLLYPSYLYLAQPVFLLWILGGFFLGTGPGQELLPTQRYAFLGAAYVDLEMGSHLVLTLSIVIGHRFAQCRSLGEAWRIVCELTGSVILCLNGVFYTSVSVCEWLVSSLRGREWVPMRKRHEALGWRRAATALWPTTGLGLLGLIFGFRYSPDWALVALPFLLSFAASIPVTFWTGQLVQPAGRGTESQTSPRYRRTSAADEDPLASSP